MTEVLLIYNKSSKFEYFRKFLGKMKLKDQFAYIFNCFISKIVIERGLLCSIRSVNGYSSLGLVPAQTKSPEFHLKLPCG